ncbi:DUF2020 domain-containing protein [uncultured Corynebacterium sp.]|uniref:DUF2020 domain-containing protein n=1 Tax=uncultured Corynebacterium sp. TaxID=159447 RepID=UPI0025F8C4B8|nr:DUF2020 domain-containing protein [uncultured Corynebacterium sp.]
MRTSLLPLLAAAALLVGCSSTDGASSDATLADAAPSVASASPAAPQAAPDGGLPADTPAEVSEWTECPYLDTQWVADTNGQRMTQLGIDTRFATPACVFWSYPEAPQATVIVRDMGSEDAAHAAVDWAAPIDSTEPVSAADTNGWEGGRGVLSAEMSVYAVAKGTKAVLVWTNQQQTLKAELIAQEAIKNLGL